MHTDLRKLTLVHIEIWPELVNTIFQQTNSGTANQKESAFRIMTAVPAVIATQEFSAITSGFVNCLRGEDSTSVKLAALKASVAYLEEKFSPKLHDASDLLVSMLNVTQANLHIFTHFKVELVYVTSCDQC
jgi:uncharacterized membrane protein